MTNAPLGIRFPSTHMGYVHTAVSRSDCMEIVEAIVGKLDDEVVGVLMDYCTKVADDTL